MILSLISSFIYWSQLSCKGVVQFHLYNYFEAPGLVVGLFSLGGARVICKDFEGSKKEFLFLGAFSLFILYSESQDRILHNEMCSYF